MPIVMKVRAGIVWVTAPAKHAPQTRRPPATGPLLGALAHAPIGQRLQVLSQQIQTHEEEPEATCEPTDDCYHCPTTLFSNRQ